MKICLPRNDIEHKERMKPSQRERMNLLLEGYSPEIRGGIQSALEAMSSIKLEEALCLMEVSTVPSTREDFRVIGFHVTLRHVKPSRWSYEQVLNILSAFWPQSLILSAKGAVPFEVFKEDDTLWSNAFEVHAQGVNVLSVWEGDTSHHKVSIEFTEKGLRLESNERETLDALQEMIVDED